MKILLLGENGQVGWELQRSLIPLGEVISYGRGSLGDLTTPEHLYAMILALKPDVVVNAAAFTAVDLAETQQELALLINYKAVKVLADICKKIKALLVHYSTDYVFSGVGEVGFLETDPKEPVNVYGETKVLGEQAIFESKCNYLIFRTSWVYASRGDNFLKTMLNLAQIKDELSIIFDQIGAPTSAELIADVSSHAISKTLNDLEKVGVYHLVADGETSWYEYASFIFEQVSLTGHTIRLKKLFPIASNEFNSKAKRPLNSRLNHDKIKNVFGVRLPDWRVGVKRTVLELLDK